MKKLALLLAVVAVVGLMSAYAFAEGGGGEGGGGAAPKAPKADTLKGKVAEIKKDASDKITAVVVEAKKSKTDVAVDDKTKVTVDGKDATLADLKVDMVVEVTPATGTATNIAAMTAAAHGKGGGKAPKAPKGGGGE